MYNLLDSINPFLAVLAIPINFTFVILVIARASRTKANYLFSLICLSIMFWNLGTFMSRLSGDQSWVYLSYFGSAGIPVWFFHFIVALLRRKMKFMIFITYITYAFLSIMPLLHLINPGFEPYIIRGVAWDIFYLVLVAPFFLLALTALFLDIKRNSNLDERSQLKFVFMAGLVGLITATSDRVQSFNLSLTIPALGHLGSVLAPSILTVAVFRHRDAYDILAQIKLKLELLQQISAGIAHEIRNPLSSIKGASRLLLKRLKKTGDAECLEYLNIINEEADRLDKILHDFIFSSKPTKFEKETISVNDVIRKTVKMVETENSGIPIKLDLMDNLQMISADASALKQVFLNMLKNSVEVCSPGKELIIKTENTRSFVKISISDNGPGIAPELLDRIFEPFFTTKKHGLGMGLHICRQIITAHEGRIEVENLVPSGTKFTIYLPA